MEDIRLPRHVIDRMENRWASRLQQDAKAWSDRGRRIRLRSGLSEGPRDVPVTIRRARPPTGNLLGREGGRIDRPAITARRGSVEKRSRSGDLTQVSCSPFL